MLQAILQKMLWEMLQEVLQEILWEMLQKIQHQIVDGKGVFNKGNDWWKFSIWNRVMGS